MKRNMKIVIGAFVICAILAVTFAVAAMRPQPYPAGNTPVNGPASASNPRPIDLNTGKHLDEEGYPSTQVDYPYVNVTS